MPRRIRFHPFLTVQELHERFRHAHDSVERSRWRFLWLLARGPTAVARVTGRSAYWIGRVAGRHNAAGPDGMGDQRHRARDPHAMLRDQQQAALRAAFAAPHPTGDCWCGRTVAAWMSARLDRRVSRQVSWRVLRRLGACFLQPRPRHIQDDPRNLPQSSSLSRISVIILFLLVLVKCQQNLVSCGVIWHCSAPSFCPQHRRRNTMTSDTRRTYLLAKERGYDVHRPVVNCSEMAYLGLLTRCFDDQTHDRPRHVATLDDTVA
jgi:hypothetical protein